MKRIIGIDPGKNGAFAGLMPDGGAVVVKMPSESDIAAVIAELSISADIPMTVYIEDIPKAIPGIVNQSTMAKLHRNFGFCLGVLSTLKIRHHLVRPQVWQKGIPGLQGKKGPDRKRALKDQACRLFPDVKVTLVNSDALLIAEYGRRQV